MKPRLLPLLAMVALLPACSDNDPAALGSVNSPTTLFSTTDPAWLYEQTNRGSGDAVGPAASADDFIVPAAMSWSITQVKLMSTSKPCDLRVFTYEGGTVTEVQTYLNVTAGASSLVFDDSGVTIYQHTITLPAALTLGPGRYWLGARGTCGPEEWDFFGFHWVPADGGHLLNAIRLNENDWSVITGESYPAGFMFAVYGTATTIDLLTPTFEFDLTTLPVKTFGDGSFSVAGSPYVSTNSNGGVTFATGAGSVGCTVTPAGVVALTGAALDPSHCIVEATLAATDVYTGAGPVAQSFNVAKAASSVSISNLPSGAYEGGSFTPAYTKVGDGTTSTASTTQDVCTVAAGVVQFVGAGECTLEASIGESDNYAAATGAQQSFTVTAVSLGSSSCTYVINPKNGQYNVMVTWANASPGVTMIRVTDGRTIQKQLAPTTTGSWSVNVKSVPEYELLGGTGRKDTGAGLKSSTACEPVT